MTDKEKEAIEYFKKRIDICMENANICDDNDFDEEATYLRKEQILTEIVLNLIQTQQAEIEKQSKEKNLIYDFLYKFGSKFSGSFMKALSEDGFDIKKCENCEI